MSSKKKYRSPNFTPEEQNVLFSLVAQYQQIIENKKSDGATIREKKEAWKEIADKFNAKHKGTFRNQSTLNKFYVNRKASVRKAVKQQGDETGGSPVGMSEADEILLNIINGNIVVNGSDSSDSDDMFCEENSKIQDVAPDIYIVDESQVADHKAENMKKIAKEPNGSKSNKPKRSFNDEAETNNHWSSTRSVMFGQNSSDVEKNNEQLIEMKLEAANLQIAIMKSELSCKQSEELFKHEEQRLKLDILKTELEIKRKQLKRCRSDEDEF